MSKKVSADRLVMLTGDLPAMPFVAYKVMEIVADPNSTIQSLQDVIENDQALAGRILKIANSALYARSRQVTTLTEAIVMLGFNTIRSLAVTSATRNLYLKSSKVLGLKDKLLWEHSVGAGVAGRLIARTVNPKLTEEAFLWGLLHDIGKLVILQKLPDEFDEIVQTVYNEGRDFEEVEMEMLGFSHATVGALLVRKWNLSESFEDAVLHHHDYLQLPPEERNPWCAYIDLANKMCKKLGVGFVRREEMNLAEDPAAQALGLDEERLEGILAMTKQMIKETADAFR
jgi:putative nucleotidyltransferase with HDIG domain